MMLFDLACGSAAIAVIMIGTMVVMAGFKQQQRQNREAFLANQYLANVAEAIDSADHTDTPVSLPDSAKTVLRGATLSIDRQRVAGLQRIREITGETTDAADFLQITCKISWDSDSIPNRKHAAVTIWRRAKNEKSAP